MKKNKGALVWIVLGVLLLVGLGYCIYDVLISVKDYNAFRGLSGSKSIGTDNFEAVFRTNAIGQSIGSSLVESLLTACLGLSFGVVLALLLGLIHHRPTKAIFAGFFLVIALLPEIYWVRAGQKAVTALWEMMAGMGYNGSKREVINNYFLIFLFAKFLPLTAMCAAGGLILNLAEKKNGALGALLVGILPLITILLPSPHFGILATNSMNMQNSNLSYQAYKNTLMNMRFGWGSAIVVVGKGISLLVGLGPAILAGLLGKRKKGLVKEKTKGNGWLMEGLFSVIGAGAAMMMVLAAAILGKDVKIHDMAFIALGNTIVGALIAGVLGFGVCLGVVCCFRYSRSMLALGALALILLLLGGFSVTGYILAKNLSLLNTPIPAACSVLGHPLFIMLVILLAAARPASIGRMMMAAGGGGVFAAMISAGDCFNPMLFVNSSDMLPLASYVRQLHNEMGVTSSAQLQTGMGSPDMYLNGGLVLLLSVCLVLGLMGAMLLFSGLGGGKMRKDEAVAAPVQPQMPAQPVYVEQPAMPLQPVQFEMPLQQEMPSDPQPQDDNQ